MLNSYTVSEFCCSYDESTGNYECEDIDVLLQHSLDPAHPSTARRLKILQDEDPLDYTQTEDCLQSPTHS